MKKADMILEILDCPLYEGDFTFSDLMKLSKVEIQDMYDAMEQAEYDYWY